jgi:uncharacterized protein YndB with AHSA1/START domain
MAENTRLVHATPQTVWDVLSDGWLYPVWVVGASRMREVDDGWPGTGTQLYHSVGIWPLLIDDSTEVKACVELERLVLRARGWPIGEAEVVIHLEPVGADTLVTIQEDAVSGPGVLAPPPVRGMTLKWRNTETLRRLAYIAEHR